MHDIPSTRPLYVLGFWALLFLAIAAGIASHVSLTRASSSLPSTASTTAANTSLTSAKLLFSKGATTQALRVYRTVLDTSRDEREKAAAHIGIGICSLSKHDYRSAVRSFEDADRLIHRHGFSDLAAVLALNRAAFYRMIGNMRAATSTIESAAEFAQGHPDITVRLQYAVAAADSGKLEAARHLIASCIADASQLGDLAIEASAWSQLATLSLQTADTTTSAEALGNALRLRKAVGDPRIGLIYANLARLYLMKHQLQLAEAMLRRATEIHNGDVLDAAVLTLAGDIANAQGKYTQALERYSAALSASYNRIAVLAPAHFLRSHAQSEIHRITTRYVHTAAAIRSKQYAASALYALELGRRLSFGPAWHRVKVPKEVSEKLHQLTVDALNGDSDALRAQFHEVRFQRDRYQVITGKPVSRHMPVQTMTSGVDFVHKVQRQLRAQEAFISILLDGKTSYLWAITKTSFEFHELPSSVRIESEIGSFMKDIAAADSAQGSGAKLGHTLFGRISRIVMSAPDWIVSADGAVMNLPLGALSVGTHDSAARYLALSKSIRMVPSAVPPSSAEPVPPSNPKTLLLYGDAIYNHADFRGEMRYKPGVGKELTRLPGTWAEMQSCAIAWLNPSRRAEFIFGRSANFRHLQTALKEPVQIFHFAGHSIGHPFDDADQALALGIDDDGKQEILTSDDIASSDSTPAVVVMSSCASARGPVVRGAGVLNLSRSWLQAGSNVVVHTHWPLPDGLGKVMTQFYRSLGSSAAVGDGRTIARALASAQRWSIRSDGLESQPMYWAAYSVISRE